MSDLFTLAPAKLDRIRELNDAFRRTFSGGRVVTTARFAELPDMVRAAALQAVAAFDSFDGTNDPYGEHDFGAFELCGRTFYWKLDYYDKEDMDSGSDDPADPEKTTRVLTVMLSDDM